jgi:hypothetical protein
MTRAEPVKAFWGTRTASLATRPMSALINIAVMSFLLTLAALFVSTVILWAAVR